MYVHTSTYTHILFNYTVFKLKRMFKTFFIKLQFLTYS